MRLVRGLSIAMVLAVGLAACGDKKPADDGPNAPDLGLKDGLSARTVVDGLMNPSGIAFDPDGDLTVCDSGHGKVIRLEDGKAKDYITGFDTEYWKIDKEKGINRFKLGPLSAVWLPDGRLVVTDGGKTDGNEPLLFFSDGGTAADGEATNTIPPTSEDPLDKGEGNLTGLSLSADGSTIYVAGQGADAKTWVLTCDTGTKKLSTWASADDNKIDVNSPMQTLVWDDSTLLVLYSGAGGKEDGRLIAWDTSTAKPKANWTLPGLYDPMGMARIPGTNNLVIVDNNWALTEVRDGRLGKVTLPDGGGTATVEMLATKMLGPVACAFDAKGDLYVAQLGKEFDKTYGSVVAISGIK